MILNGITEFVTRPDLQSRSMPINVEKAKSFKPDEKLDAEFEQARPRILGVLLDHLVRGVRYLPDTNLDDLPRMAGFVTWGVACGLTDFRSRYEQNQLDSTYAILEGDGLASAINALMIRRKKPWIGTAGELAERLKRFGFDSENPRLLSARIRRLTPALLGGYGIEVKFLPRKNTKRPLQITRIEA
jgi:hypothetical protein